MSEVLKTTEILKNYQRSLSTSEIQKIVKGFYKCPEYFKIFLKIEVSKYSENFPKVVSGLYSCSKLSMIFLKFRSGL